MSKRGEELMKLVIDFAILSSDSMEAIGKGNFHDAHECCEKGLEVREKIQVIADQLDDDEGRSKFG